MEVWTYSTSICPLFAQFPTIALFILRSVVLVVKPTLAKFYFMSAWTIVPVRIFLPLSLARLSTCNRIVIVAADASFESSRLSLRRTMTTTNTTTTTVISTDPKIWDGSDEASFYSLEHPGYSLDSHPTTFLGGWHAHRKVWEDELISHANDNEVVGTTSNKNSSPSSTTTSNHCWIKDQVMPMITHFDYMSMPIGRSPRILVLYGSLRPTSFSRKTAYEFARLLDLLGCDVRIYNPRGLPVRDPDLENELKVLELRALTQWSDGHMWVRTKLRMTHFQRTWTT
jgi:hypothetical protein